MRARVQYDTCTISTLGLPVARCHQQYRHFIHSLSLSPVRTAQRQCTHVSSRAVIP